MIYDCEFHCFSVYALVAISENVTIKSSEQSAAVRLEVIDDDIVRGDITVEIGVIPEVGTGLATIEIKENDSELNCYFNHFNHYFALFAKNRDSCWITEPLSDPRDSYYSCFNHQWSECVCDNSSC